MSLSTFLDDLRETGQVRLPAWVSEEAQEEEAGKVAAILRELDAAARLEMPGEAPPFHLAAARWGAEIVFRACQFLTYREVDGAAVERELSRPCPERPSPAAVHSADLVLRHLPGIIALARGIAPGDPLVTALSSLATAWPFSSAGVPDVKGADVSTFADDPSLLQTFADRVIEKRDAARLDDPRVREAARASIGLFRDLAPEISMALAKAGDP